jgi:hypothetical protein
VVDTSDGDAGSRISVGVTLDNVSVVELVLRSMVITTNLVLVDSARCLNKAQSKPIDLCLHCTVQSVQSFEHTHYLG